MSCLKTPIHLIQKGFVKVFDRKLHLGHLRLCEKHARRQYLSRMLLFPTNKMKEGGFTCKSQDLFLYNEIVFPCHLGAYLYLPMGLRSLEKLTRLIDEEMQAIGAQKILMPTMMKASLWKKTERWNTAELFKLKDRQHKEYCLGPTHEELVTFMISQYSNISYKRLPIMLYQITRKFRDEMHPKNGLLRGREFEMKDMYTFDMDEEKAKLTYNNVCEAYSKIFDRLKLKYMKVEASVGNIGGKLSHEYHLPADIGEDTIYQCNSCGFAANVELLDPSVIKSDDVKCTRCMSQMTKHSGIEVGHAFLLGDKYSKVMNSYYINQSLKPVLTEMGCYGLGVSRILQASVEVMSKGDMIRWPAIIAPYQICLVPQKEGYKSEEFNELTDSLSDTLNSLPNLRNEVVIDDRIKLTVGKRLFEAKSRSYSYIVVVGRESLNEGGLYEVIDVLMDTTEFLTLEQLVDKFSKIPTI